MNTVVSYEHEPKFIACNHVEVTVSIDIESRQGIGLILRDPAQDRGAKGQIAASLRDIEIISAADRCHVAVPIPVEIRNRKAIFGKAAQRDEVAGLECSVPLVLEHPRIRSPQNEVDVAVVVEISDICDV